LPDRAHEAKELLDSAIVQAAASITEGRDAVQGLRTSTLEGNDLAEGIRTLGDELARIAPRPASFRVAVEGTPRDLRPILRDEIYKIAAEALRNAYRHAEAGHIEVELRYGRDELRMRVRDDGKGIDPAVLASDGSQGHYGLRGLRERAALAGGELTIWSDAGAGTEVELRVPASVVYQAAPRRPRFFGRSASGTPPKAGDHGASVPARGEPDLTSGTEVARRISVDRYVDAPPSKEPRVDRQPAGSEHHQRAGDRGREKVPNRGLARRHDLDNRHHGDHRSGDWRPESDDEQERAHYQHRGGDDDVQRRPAPQPRAGVPENDRADDQSHEQQASPWPSAGEV
jgi:hypothetical protein